MKEQLNSGFTLKILIYLTIFHLLAIGSLNGKHFNHFIVTKFTIGINPDIDTPTKGPII